jgi:hypothetical protein
LEQRGQDILRYPRFAKIDDLVAGQIVGGPIILDFGENNVLAYAAAGKLQNVIHSGRQSHWQGLGVSSRG